MLCDCSSLSCDTQPLWWHCEASEWTSSQPQWPGKYWLIWDLGLAPSWVGRPLSPCCLQHFGTSTGVCCNPSPARHRIRCLRAQPHQQVRLLVGMCLRAASSDPGGNSFHLFQSSWTAFQKHLALQVVRAQPPPASTPLPGRSWIFSIQQGRCAFPFPSLPQRWL